MAYHATLTATGGTTPYTWSVAAGSSLPTGLSLSGDGLISGTPSAAGTTNVTVEVNDPVRATLAISIGPAAAAATTSTGPTLADTGADPAQAIAAGGGLLLAGGLLLLAGARRRTRPAHPRHP